jgi:hypothetical protein
VATTNSDGGEPHIIVTTSGANAIDGIEMSRAERVEANHDCLNIWPLKALQLVGDRRNEVV